MRTEALFRRGWHRRTPLALPARRRWDGESKSGMRSPDALRTVFCAEASVAVVEPRRVVYVLGEFAERFRPRRGARDRGRNFFTAFCERQVVGSSAGPAAGVRAGRGTLAKKAEAALRRRSAASMLLPRVVGELGGGCRCSLGFARAERHANAFAAFAEERLPGPGRPRRRAVAPSSSRDRLEVAP